MNMHQLTRADLQYLKDELESKPHRLEELGVVNEMPGCTPLIGACFDKGNFEVVKFLVEKGANVNCKSQGGSTPLMMASFIGSSQMVKYLIENGAEIDATNLVIIQYAYSFFV
jgi:ankyrin repeat protein